MKEIKGSSGEFFPAKNAKAGDRVEGIYLGVFDGTYQGKPKQYAHIETATEVFKIGGANFLTMFAPKLEKGRLYNIVYQGKVPTKNGQMHSFQVFDVNAE